MGWLFGDSQEVPRLVPGNADRVDSSGRDAAPTPTNGSQTGTSRITTNSPTFPDRRGNPPGITSMVRHPSTFLPREATMQPEFNEYARQLILRKEREEKRDE